MNKRDYERKRQKIRRQKRFQTNKRAASRHIPKAAKKVKVYIKDDDWIADDLDDAPNGVQYRE